MTHSLHTKKDILDFLKRLDLHFGEDATLFLVGESTQVVEGWRSWTPRIELCSSVRSSRRARFNECLSATANELGFAVTDECPGEIVPLPAGHQERSRELDTGLGTRLRVRHYDPYSVAIRFIARGDEPDYHLVLAYLQKGWINLEAMNTMLDGLLPEFSMSTIQQDPAEFRRKYSGMLQMAGAIDYGVTYRPTPV